VKVGVPGPATVAHLNLEQLNVLAKVRLKAVFFDGGQVRATILGQIDAGIGGPGPIIPYLNTGEGVALGVFDENRLRLVRDAPTFKELGYDVTLGSIQAIVAPPGTPANVVNVLDEAIRKAVAEPSFIAFAEKTQNTIDYKGPAAFAAELRDSFKKNGDLLRALGLAKE
jgi:putative tricarboxylic transport membrane protein